ncbi:MAG: hypoxanthine phosphoribosyltransferase [Bacteroidota bacterium]|nr:hypoxanthine phosphoribosyltransferase [Candidatus Kapabacteria bacterium]MDW8219672.1 hypoxanthine phosphoribosyltransferase [Bacteroidota bacterium]
MKTHSIFLSAQRPFPEAHTKPNAMTIDTSVIQLHDKQFKKLVTRDQIAHAVRRLAAQITQDYNGNEVVFVVVLKGSFLFAADLLREVTLPCTVEFIRAESYGALMHSSGTVSITHYTGQDLAGKHVVILEDIVDTGLTVRRIVTHLQNMNPMSLAIATLFFKPDVCRGTVEPKYVGFEISPLFIVGYGLDYNELGRNLADVYVLHTS